MGEQDAFGWMAHELKRADDMRVLLKLLALLDFENWVRISQAEIGRDLEMHRSNVSRSFARLVELGIIDKAKVGNQNVYRMSAEIAWKGREGTRQQALRNKADALGISVVKDD